MGKLSHGTVVTWTGYEQQECDLVAGWSAISDGRGVDLGQWLALSSRRKRKTLMLTHRLSTSSFYNSTRRVAYSGRRRHTQYSCVYYSLTTFEWKNGQQEIVAAGWAAEGDEKLVWAQGGDEKEVIDWTEIININERKNRNIVCNWVLFLTAFDYLSLVVHTKALDLPSKGINLHWIAVLGVLLHSFKLSCPVRPSGLHWGGGGSIDHIQNYIKVPWAKTKSLSLHFLLVRPFLGII